MERFWRVAVILLIIGLFYVGTGLRGAAPPLPVLVSPALASGVSVANDEVETVITVGNDGKTVYVWRYFGSKPPTFLGKAEVPREE